MSTAKYCFELFLKIKKLERNIEKTENELNNHIKNLSEEENYKYLKELNTLRSAGELEANKK